MFDSYLARQSILDRNERLVGYELLYRSDHGRPSVVDGDRATTEVFINSYIEIGLSKLVGNHLAFIKVTRHFLANHGKLPPPSKQLVLEVHENAEADSKVVAAVKALIAKNYNIALDDFNSSQTNERLIQFARFANINIPRHNSDELAKLVTSLRNIPTKLLAKNVETPEQYDYCRELGFDYYQGDILCHPKLVRGPRLSANRLHVMQLLAKLQQDYTNVSDLTKIIEQDVALSFKLLRYINSASFLLRNKIESLRHAVIVLGQKNIKKWAAMIALSRIEEKSGELIRTALLRGKMCELLVKASGQGNHESAFMVGLFSTLEALMGEPLDELLTTLPINQDIKDALLYQKGPYRNAWKCTLAYEQGDWQAVEDNGYSENSAASCYLQAVEWSDDSACQLAREAA